MSDDKSRKATHDDIARLAGDLGELKTARIIEAGATVEELEEACTLAGGDGEAIRQRHVDLTGVVADIYEILTQDEAYAEDR